MGTKLSIDKHVSNIEEILEMSPSYFTKLKFENKIPDSITQHIKIWRYFEEDKKSKNIKSAPLSLQAIQNSSFTFVSNECYLVLFVYKKGTEDPLSIANFPHSMWGTVESYSNLTPRGLEVPVASSESLSSLNKEVLESFLLPKRLNKKDDGKYEYMIFTWNGKTANPLVKSMALSAAFELDAFINKAKEPLLQVLFSGGVVRNKKLQKGTILQLNSQISKDGNKDIEKKFSSVKEAVYLFKFLFPSSDQRQQHSLFTEKFLHKSENIRPEEHYIVVEEDGERPVVEAYEEDEMSPISHNRRDDKQSPEFLEEESLLSSDRKDTNPQANMRLGLPIGQNENESSIEHSELHSHRGQSKPKIPKLFERREINNEPSPEYDNQEIEENNDEEIDSSPQNMSSMDNEPPLQSSRRPGLPLNLGNLSENNFPHEPRQNNQPNGNPRIGLPLNIIREPQQLPTTYEELLEFQQKGIEVPELLAKRLKMEYFGNICSAVIPGLLYVGGEQIATNINHLHEFGITHIVNAAGDVIGNLFADEIEYLTYYLKDSKSENIECIFYDTINFIERAREQNGRVLVHCVQGVSRSVTLCMAYIMFKNKLKYDEAYNQIKQKRGVANPNVGFIAQLMVFHQRITYELESNAVRIFCIGSHQRETPQYIVARMISENIFAPNSKKGLDPRTIYIIQTRDVLYLWIGNEILESNYDRYLQKAEEHIHNLQTYEKAPSTYITVHCNEEPAEFWEIWGGEPENKYCKAKENDYWFVDLSTHKNVEGPTIVAEEKGVIEEPEPVSIRKRTLYRYRMEQCTAVDFNDLTEDQFFILCHEKDGVKTAYIWKGEQFDISEEDEEAYVREVLKHHWPEEDFEAIHKRLQSHDEEDDEFVEYFG